MDGLGKIWSRSKTQMGPKWMVWICGKVYKVTTERSSWLGLLFLAWLLHFSGDWLFFSEPSVQLFPSSSSLFMFKYYSSLLFFLFNVWWLDYTTPCYILFYYHYYYYFFVFLHVYDRKYGMCELQQMRNFYNYNMMIVLCGSRPQY